MNKTIDKNKNKNSEFFISGNIPNPLREKVDYLEARIKKLGDICSELNPYAPISDDLKMRLMDFNILDLSDPFKITNTLLILLEDTIDELHVIKPFNDLETPVKEIL